MEFLVFKTFLMRCRFCFRRILVSVFLLFSMTGVGVAQGPLLDWPTLLHDPQLSARSHLQGNIIAPRVAWSYSLGLGRPDRVDDPTREGPVLLGLNGDGISEKIGVEYGGSEFSVHDGASGALLWSVTTEQPIFEDLFSVADVNADGTLDLCLVTHYRAEVFDGVTGLRLHHMPWDVGRNYGFNIWDNFDEDPQLECLILADYTAHVDYLDTGPDGKATHVWSIEYLRNPENEPLDLKLGHRDLRFLYKSVGDLDGNGNNKEAVYMVYNLKDRKRWWTRVLQPPSERELTEQEGLFVLGIENADGEGSPELFACIPNTFAVLSFATLEIWRLNQGALEKVCDLGHGRFVMTEDLLAPNAASNGSRSGETTTVLLSDLDGDGNREFVVERDSDGDGLADGFEVMRLGKDGRTESVMTYLNPGGRYALSDVVQQGDRTELRGYDVQTGDDLVFRQDGTVLSQPASRSWLFISDPVAGDINGDGLCEVVVQNADGWIQTLQVTGADQAPTLLWQVRGWGMNQSPSYTIPSRGVVLADLDGDGRSEVLYAGINDAGFVTLSVVDCNGRPVWEHVIEGVSPSWRDCGLDQWAIGLFTEDSVKRFENKKSPDDVLDVVVQYHDLGHSSAKLRALDGSDGSQLWDVVEVHIDGSARPLYGKNLLVDDLNGNGLSEVANTPAYGLSVLSGANGSQMLGRRHSASAYFSKITTADVNGDGCPELFFNDLRACGGMHLYSGPDTYNERDARQLWSQGRRHTHHDPAPGYHFNPLLADFDQDGKLEFCSPRQNKRLVVNDALTGETKGEFSLPVTPTTEIILCDINGDGVSDLLFGSGNTLYAVSTNPRGSSQLKVHWSHEFPARIGCPVPADVDRDGQAEVLVPVNNSMLYCLDAE